MTQSFTIRSQTAGIWWTVRIHDSLDQMRATATRHRPRDNDLDNTMGLCQPTNYWEDEDGLCPPPHNYGGIIRYAADWLDDEVFLHEIVHAAAASYRHMGRLNVNLGRDCGRNEELFAHIYGELAADLLWKLRGRVKIAA